jgi:hypothetical protein
MGNMYMLFSSSKKFIKNAFGVFLCTIQGMLDVVDFVELCDVVDVVDVVDLKVKQI